jgi:DNA polymerase epsilon subunit 4
MEIDVDTLPADIPEAQAVQAEHEGNDDDGNDATTSKKKAPRKPRAVPTKPTERTPGTTSLPVARVKRILGADEDLQNISKEALFLISIATVSLPYLYVTTRGSGILT